MRAQAATVGSARNILNDQFKTTDFNDYLAILEAATPTIRALGVTDYYSLDCYEHVCTAKEAGRLPQCDLIFPTSKCVWALRRSKTNGSISTFLSVLRTPITWES